MGPRHDSPATTGAEVFMRTTDAGSSWTTLNAARVYFRPLTSVSSLAQWLVGRRGAKKEITPVALRTDGGVDLGEVTLPEGRTPAACSRWRSTSRMPTHGWLVAHDASSTGQARWPATRTAGATWNVVRAGPVRRRPDRSVDFVDSRTGWAAGTGIWSTTRRRDDLDAEVAGSRHRDSVAAADAGHVGPARRLGILSTVDAAGDTAPPMTLCDGSRRLDAHSVTPALSAGGDDVGASGRRVHRVPRWTAAPGRRATPPPFLAPSDHSGDGTHIAALSLDRQAPATSNPRSRLRVRVDTVKPVTRLGRSVVGRDGVLRMRLRIDDRVVRRSRSTSGSASGRCAGARSAAPAGTAPPGRRTGGRP